MTFQNVRFPTDISYGAIGGPRFKTTILTLTSGHEKRNIDWSQVRCEYDVSKNVQTETQINTVQDFFYARNGRAYGFRYKDWTDYKLVRQSIGTTDGSTTEFQIYKRYTSNAVNYDRTITKIVSDSDVDSYTFSAWVGGSSQTVVEGSSPGASQVAIDRDTGIVTLGSTLAAASGDDIEVQCEFDVPVRFDTDHLAISAESFNNFSWGSIPLVEIRDIT